VIAPRLLLEGGGRTAEVDTTSAEAAGRPRRVRAYGPGMGARCTSGLSSIDFPRQLGTGPTHHYRVTNSDGCKPPSHAAQPAHDPGFVPRDPSGDPNTPGSICQPAHPPTCHMPGCTHGQRTTSTRRRQTPTRQIYMSHTQACHRPLLPCRCTIMPGECEVSVSASVPCLGLPPPSEWLGWLDVDLDLTMCKIDAVATFSDIREVCAARRSWQPRLPSRAPSWTARLMQMS
jgi:hypothetical protein